MADSRWPAFGNHDLITTFYYVITFHCGPFIVAKLWKEGGGGLVIRSAPVPKRQKRSDWIEFRADVSRKYSTVYFLSSCEGFVACLNFDMLNFRLNRKRRIDSLSIYSTGQVNHKIITTILLYIFLYLNKSVNLIGYWCVYIHHFPLKYVSMPSVVIKNLHKPH